MERKQNNYPKDIEERTGANVFDPSEMSGQRPPINTPKPKTSRRDFLQTAAAGLALGIGGRLATTRPQEHSSVPKDEPAYEKNENQFYYGEAPKKLREDIIKELREAKPIDFFRLEQRLLESMVVFELEWGFEPAKQPTIEMKQHAKAIAEGIAVLMGQSDALPETSTTLNRDLALVHAWLETTAHASYDLHLPYVEGKKLRISEEDQPESVQEILIYAKHVLPKGFLKLTNGKRTLSEQRQIFLENAKKETVRKKLEERGWIHPEDDMFDWNNKERLKQIQNIIRTHADFEVSVPTRHAPHVRGAAVDFAVRNSLRKALDEVGVDRSIVLEKVVAWAKRKMEDERLVQKMAERGEELMFHVEDGRNQKVLHVAKKQA